MDLGALRAPYAIYGVKSILSYGAFCYDRFHSPECFKFSRTYSASFEKLPSAFHHLFLDR